MKTITLIKHIFLALVFSFLLANVVHEGYHALSAINSGGEVTSICFFGIDDGSVGWETDKNGRRMPDIYYSSILGYFSNKEEQISWILGLLSFSLMFFLLIYEDFKKFNNCY